MKLSGFAHKKIMAVTSGEMIAFLFDDFSSSKVLS